MTILTQWKTSSKIGEQRPVGHTQGIHICKLWSTPEWPVTRNQWPGLSARACCGEHVWQHGAYTRGGGINENRATDGVGLVWLRCQRRNHLPGCAEVQVVTTTKGTDVFDVGAVVQVQRVHLATASACVCARAREKWSAREQHSGVQVASDRQGQLHTPHSSTTTTSKCMACTRLMLT